MQWTSQTRKECQNGEPLHRDRGRIFAELSANKLEGIEANDLVELQSAYTDL